MQEQVRVEEERSREDWAEEKQKVIGKFPLHEKFTRGRGIHHASRKEKQTSEEMRDAQRKKGREESAAVFSQQKIFHREREILRAHERERDTEREREREWENGEKEPLLTLLCDIIFFCHEREERSEREREEEEGEEGKE